MEGVFERHFGTILLATMLASGVGIWWATDSLWLGAVGVAAPPTLAFLIWIVNDVHTHLQHGSGVKPDGSIQWRGEN
jgi:hypothetical protein